MDADIALAIAAYVIYHMNLLVQGCGKRTDAISIHKDGTIDSLHEYQAEDLDRAFGRCLKEQACQVHWLLGSKYPFSHEDNIKRYLESVRKAAQIALDPSKVSNFDNSQT